MTKDQWYHFFYPFIRWTVGVIYPIKVIGRSNIPEDGGLICANHCSALDPIFVAIAMGSKHPIRPMAKDSLFKIPFLRKIMPLIGAFSVRRGASDIQAIKFALHELGEGSYVLLFPEGTRVASREEGEPKTGAAMLATRAGVQVIPVYVPFRKRLFRLNRVYVGESFRMIPAGRRATSAEYEVFTAELMDKIYGAGDGK